MKYLLLIHPRDAREEFNRLPEERQEAIVSEYRALSQDPHVFESNQLEPATTATTVRVADGETLVTDGPFVAVKEALGGYYLCEADDLDGAVALAARIPAARMGGAIEVRPVMER